LYECIYNDVGCMSIYIMLYVVCMNLYIGVCMSLCMNVYRLTLGVIGISMVGQQSADFVCMYMHKRGKVGL